MKKQTILTYILENDIKIADLKILKFLYKNKSTKTKADIEKGCKLNFYQIDKILLEQIELGFVKKSYKANKTNDKQKVSYTINKENPIVIKFFEDIK